ncbi:MAG: hypothetical protein MSG64_16775 [Pyrinomonadaceae bacterium MAG19_C2-C3]|nr:hypothetical protein [Pyrinomonadaceae bacterium MAG19_C2-C3]
MDERSNFFLALAGGAGSFVVSDRFVESAIVAVFLFLCGKCVDLFLKPILEERRARTRQKLAEAETENQALREFFNL